MEYYRMMILLMAVSSTCGAKKGNSTHILASYLKHLLAKPAALKTLHQLGVDYLNQASIFNTTVDFTIPLFSFSLPTKENPQDGSAIARQNLLGQAIFLGVVVVCFVASIALPVIINKVNQDQNSRDQHEPARFLDVAVGKCFLRTVCATHRDTEQFGLIGHLVRLLFPNSIASDRDLIGMAAHLGATDTRKCHQLYTCPYNFLRVARFMVTAIIKAYITS